MSAALDMARPVMPRMTLTPAECADLLVISEATFRRRWRLLVDRHGFPPHLPGLTLRWSMNAVLDWIGGNGASAAQPTDDAPDKSLKDRALDGARARLQLRYVQGGRP